MHTNNPLDLKQIYDFVLKLEHNQMHLMLLHESMVLDHPMILHLYAKLVHQPMIKNSRKLFRKIKALHLHHDEYIMMADLNL